MTYSTFGVVRIGLNKVIKGQDVHYNTLHFGAIALSLSRPRGLGLTYDNLLTELAYHRFVGQQVATGVLIP